MISTLVVMHVGTNVGYAIAPLERTLYEVALDLAGGREEAVHFAYVSMALGAPATLPPGSQTLVFNSRDESTANVQRLADYVRRHRINVVVFFDKQPLSSIFRVLRVVGVRTILSYWGAEISSRNAGWRLALKRMQVALSRSRLDGLIFESRAMAELAVFGRGVPWDLIDVVPLGVDLSIFTPSKTGYVFDVLKIPRDRKIVVYAGHMEARKGVKTLIEAAIDLVVHRQRKDMTLLLFGDKGDERVRFEAMYAGLAIADHIRFVGYRSDIADCFAGAYVGVVPSTGWDSFPRTSVELAACGLPIVASRLGGLPECVAHGETGFLFEPGNAKQLADRLEELLNDASLAARMGLAARARCERAHEATQHKERLKQVILRRIGGPPRDDL